MSAPTATIHLYDGNSWSENNAEIDTLVREPIASQSCLVFLQRATFLRDNALRARLEQHYGIPECFWSTLCARHNGYFGCEDVFDQQPALVGHNSWFRFQVKKVKEVSVYGVRYKWHDFTFHTAWKAPNVHHVLCFDIDDQFRIPIVKALNKQSSTHLAGVNMPHCALVSIVVEAYESSVWALRDWIRDIEQRRMSKTRPETDYPLLHELTRHACHSSETLSMAVETIAKMIVQYEAFSSPQGTPVPITHQLQQHLDFQLSLLRGLHARSRAVETRLSNELNLKINMVAQEESRATVRISQAAQSDGAAMKAVAVVTLLFLPSTFVSTIFSMSFFNYQPGQSWAMSGMVWLYFLFTVPLTVVAMCAWIWWQRKHKPQNTLYG